MNERNAAAYEEDVRRVEEEQKLFEEYNEMVKKRQYVSGDYGEWF
jgi:uncharacterized protein YutD